MTVSSPRQPRRALSQGRAKVKSRGHSCTMPGYGTVLEPSPQYPAPGRFRCCLLDVPPVTGETHTHSLPRGSTVHVHAPKPASHNSRLPHMRAALGTPWVPMMCIFPLPSVQTVSSVSAGLRRLHTLEQKSVGQGIHSLYCSRQKMWLPSERPM